MTKTYKQIVETFRDICDRHKMVNTFVNNHPLEINESNPIFPVVAVYPGLTPVYKNSMKLKLKFFVMDQLNDDESNEVEILSDTLQISKDFFDELVENEELYGFTLDMTNLVGEPFAENFRSSEGTDIEDYVAGWYFELDIDVVSEKNNCITPINEVIPTPPTPSPSECPQGETLYSIVSYNNPNSITIDSPVYLFRNPTHFSICGSDLSDGFYTGLNGSYITGGTQGYLFTFSTSETITPSLINLGNFYLDY